MHVSFCTYFLCNFISSSKWRGLYRAHYVHSSKFILNSSTYESVFQAVFPISAILTHVNLISFSHAQLAVTFSYQLTFPVTQVTLQNLVVKKRFLLSIADLINTRVCKWGIQENLQRFNEYMDIWTNKDLLSTGFLFNTETFYTWSKRHWYYNNLKLNGKLRKSVKLFNCPTPYHCKTYRRCIISTIQDI